MSASDGMAFTRIDLGHTLMDVYTGCLSPSNHLFHLYIQHDIKHNHSLIATLKHCQDSVIYDDYDENLKKGYKSKTPFSIYTQEKIPSHPCHGMAMGIALTIRIDYIASTEPFHFPCFSLLLSLSLSLSLSHCDTHIHTHTHTLPLSRSLSHSHTQKSA